jgi:hypothetical protein
MTKFLILCVFVFVATTAYADTDLVTQSGTWGTTCPPVLCVNPGDAWNYSFQTDSTLTPLVPGAIGAGAGATTVTDFNYMLDRILDISIFGDYGAEWFLANDDGGFSLYTPVLSIAFGESPQMIEIPNFLYPYDTCALPSYGCQVLPGSYAIGTNGFSFERITPGDGGAGAVYCGVGIFDATATCGPVVITDISAPEPSSVILLFTALLAVLFVMRKQILRLDWKTLTSQEAG